MRPTLRIFRRRVAATPCRRSIQPELLSHRLVIWRTSTAHFTLATTTTGATPTLMVRSYECGNCRTTSGWSLHIFNGLTDVSFPSRPRSSAPTPAHRDGLIQRWTHDKPARTEGTASGGTDWPRESVGIASVPKSPAWLRKGFRLF